MFAKNSPVPKISPWGDDHPEKLTPKSPRTIGLGEQASGLFNPDKILSQFFGEKGNEAFPSAAKERRVARQETLVFSYTNRKEEVQLQKETQLVLKQLKEQVTLLEKAEKSLNKDITKVKVEQLPRKTGIYYLRFLEWLIILVRQLRIKVDEGRAWLTTFSQRKKKRMGYWKMYKKHGTTFGLSYERTLSTQTG